MVVVEDVFQPMFNLTVDEAHTFFIGGGDWLVHNVDCWFGPKPETIHDRTLREIVNQDYRYQSTSRNAGTADAVMNEITTGSPTGGSWHFQKNYDLSQRYNRWLQNNPEASLIDRQTAARLYNQNVAAAQYVLQNRSKLPGSLPSVQIDAINRLFPKLQTIPVPME